MIEKKTGSCKNLPDTALYISRAWRNGRRAALRMLWIKIRGGSNPPARTKAQNALCTASIHTHYRTATLFLCHPGARPHPLSPRGLTAGPRLINSSRSDTNRCCLCWRTGHLFTWIPWSTSTPQKHSFLRGPRATG